MALAARQHRHRHLVDLGGGEDEDDVGGRLLERLQERVEGVLGEHVHFVDDVDLVARRDRLVADAVGELADVVDAGARRCVHLHHIDMPILGDGAAGLALPAGRDRRTALPVGADAIERARQDARRRRLADAAHAGEDEGVRDALRGDGVGERLHHRLLPDQLGEDARPVFAREHPVVGAGLIHGDFDDARRKTRMRRACDGSRWEADQRPRPKLVTAASFRT